MKNIKNLALSLIVLTIIIVASGFTISPSVFKNNETVMVVENKQKQTLNLFVTHGHCSTPFTGVVDNLKVNAPIRSDLGNPLEDMKISFVVNPNSFSVCAGDDLTAKIKTPGLFIGKNDEKIIFKTTEIYTMGIDWYQVNGKMSIKGIEKDVTLFATGIKKPKETKTRLLVLEGQINLFDWGIDYDKIVNGKTEINPTKWMYINMKIEMS
ncbi:YceI family protein [uncultured Lacinutrix sp.]|uniref:YceI family protein n=1 Tax=uncultured Lacinutrix sp. TaxID=574032 RepID=UPI0026280627|nr:YceI family protein [uncultured Lacinutrix sp.]